MTPATHSSPSRLALIGAFAAIYVVWGSTYLAILIAIETVPPFLMAGFRFLFAGLALYGWMRFQGGVAGSGWRPWAWAVVVGGLMMAGGNGVVTWAEQWVPSGLASVIVATVPIWMVGLDATVFGGRKLTATAVAGLVLGMLGVVLLASPGGDSAAMRGIVMLVLASLSWSVGSLLSRRVNHPSSLAMAGMQMIAGGVILVLWGTLVHEWRGFDVAAISTRSWIAFVYLVTFGSILALGCYVWLMRVSTASAVSTYAFVNPVVAVFLGWAFAGERLGINEWIAAAFILGAVVLLQMKRKPRSVEAAKPATREAADEPEPAEPCSQVPTLCQERA